MKRLRIAALLAAVCATGALAQQPGQRGALLYENHCGACHATQMHWRDKRVASDWASLRAQVKRWQDTALLSWSDEEIDEVARYLNKRFYRFDEPTTRVSRAGG